MAEVKVHLREAIGLWLSVDDKKMESNIGDQVLEMTI